MFMAPAASPEITRNTHVVKRFWSSDFSYIFVPCLSDEAIDEESFGYLDLQTINTLIPRIGDRLKFIKKHNDFVSYARAYTVTTS